MLFIGWTSRRCCRPKEVLQAQAPTNHLLFGTMPLRFAIFIEPAFATVSAELLICSSAELLIYAGICSVGLPRHSTDAVLSWRGC